MCAWSLCSHRTTPWVRHAASSLLRDGSWKMLPHLSSSNTDNDMTLRMDKQIGVSSTAQDLELESGAVDLQKVSHSLPT